MLAPAQLDVVGARILAHIMAAKETDISQQKDVKVDAEKEEIDRKKQMDTDRPKVVGLGGLKKMMVQRPWGDKKITGSMTKARIETIDGSEYLHRYNVSVTVISYGSRETQHCQIVSLGNRKPFAQNQSSTYFLLSYQSSPQTSPEDSN